MNDVTAENKNNRIFCAQESVERAEQFLGTTTHYNCYLLVEYDGRWSCDVSNMLDHSSIDPEAKLHIDRFLEWCPEDVKLLFIKNNHKRQDTAKKLYLTRETNGKVGVSEFEFDSYNEIAQFDLEDAYHNIGESQDIVVVCTHGKRDKCCAKYGFPVYQRLADELVSANSDFSVWECTHVGGDRFAANVLWLPFGVGFGHCQQFTDEFLDKLKMKKISFWHLRGSSVFPDAAQYLEGVIRKENGLDEPGGVTLSHYDELSGANGNTVVRVEMIFSALGNAKRTAYVRVLADTSEGLILASCNKNGYSYPIVYELERVVGV